MSEKVAAEYNPKGLSALQSGIVSSTSGGALVSGSAGIQSVNLQTDIYGGLIVVPEVGGSPITSANPLPVALQEAIGSLTWTKTNPTLDGSSDTILAANAARKGVIVSNPAGNAAAAVDITGGTASLTNGIPLPAGTSMSFTGADCPVGAITAIGTNTNKLVVFEGT